MTRSLALRSLLWALALLGPFPAFAQTPTVSGVEIRGSKDPSLLRHLVVGVHQPVDPEAIRSSVLLLSATDLFDEVSVDQEAEPDGTVRLIFEVVESPRVNELRFVSQVAEGGSDIPFGPGMSTALSRASGLRSGETLRDRTVADAMGRITEWLRSNAYGRATVEAEVLPTEKNSRPGGLFRDILIRVLQAKQETLVSCRIDGWPKSLPPPKTPGRLGEPLTAEALEAWQKELLATLWKNAFYRAQVKHDSVAGDLVFFVTPGPPFDLKFPSPMPEKERERARSRFEEEGLSQDAIEGTTSVIESEYLERGHRDVQVDFQEVTQGDRVTGEFVAGAGPAWTLASIKYQTEGAVPVAPAPDLATGVPWLDANIEAEKVRLRNEFVQQGYANALVSHEESGEPGKAEVTFKIVPGSLSRVGSVGIEGAPPPANRSPSAAVELATRETSPFRAADVARDRTTLLASLRDDGYVDARVEARTDFSDDRTRVAVTFLVHPGPRVRVGRILVVGLRDTREIVVLRESRLKEGDFLSYQKLLDTQTGLSATGLFTNVQIQELASQDVERSLIIDVTEGPRTTIVPGLGFAETERLRASLELTKLNISGRGRTASLFLRGSIRGSRALLSLTEPYAFHRRQTVNLQLYADDDRSGQILDFHRLGFQAQTIFPMGFSNLLARYTFQKTTTTNVAQSCAEINRALCDGKISGPSLGFVHDTRNDALDPRRGSLYSTEALLSMSQLGGDSFFKGSVFAARYEEVRAGAVLAASVRLGLSRAFGASTDLPLPERFFAGGASLMRGFKTDEVGPGALATDGVFVPAGGDALLAAAVEARIDVTKYWGVQVFAETGNVFPKVSSVRLRDLREIAGAGLRYRSPFGPLRLDWGFKLDRRAGESRHQLHLGVGYAF
jgi:outer membrane protein insertion porin family